MQQSDENVDKVVEHLKEAEARVERDEARLIRDQADEKKAIEELEAAERRQKVTISVDGIEHKVRAGQWIVGSLKEHLGIDAAKVLAQITSHGLIDLADGDTIELHELERFMTHARSGGSS